MRTMLISLILLCSLTQLAIAQPAPVPREKGSERKCGPLYACYVPAICTETNLPANALLNQYGVKKVEPTTEITSDCPALIRYHLYSTHWMHVWIESLQSIETVDYIEFIYTSGHGSGAKIHETFSCQIDSNKKLIGKFGADEKFSPDSALPSKLMCKFEMKTRGDPIFKPKDASDYKYLKFKVAFITPASVPPKQIIETKIVHGDLLAPEVLPKCDPSYFEFKPDTESSTKLFEEVGFEPGNYHCKKDNYRMEFKRTNEETDRYEPAAKIECKLDHFVIENKKEFEYDDTIEIRCFAETRFLCKYEVLNGGTEETRVVGPDMDPTALSKLKCPGDLPHLIIMERGRPKVVRNPVFECKTFGGDPMWTVGTNMLMASGPAAYCTKEAGKKLCNLIKKIPDNAVKNGFLDEYGLPRCYDEGTLKTEVEQHVVSKPRCDFEDGIFKYTADKREHIVDDGTKFECVYTVHVDEKQDQKTKDTMVAGALGAGFGVLALVAIVFALASWYGWYRYRRDRKRREEAADAAWVKYGMNEEEKKAYDKANNIKTNESSSSPPCETWNWNDMLMSYQYKTLIRNGTGSKFEFIGQRSAASICSSFVDDRLKVQENLVKCAPKKSLKSLEACAQDTHVYSADAVHSIKERTYSIPNEKEASRNGKLLLRKREMEAAKKTN